MINANDSLNEFSGGSENLHKYNFGLVITEGVLSLAKKFECFWFLDIIASYQPQLQKEEFQVWTLTKHSDSSATVVCTDGNDGVLKTQTVPWTDFNADTCMVWVEFGTALLSIEH